MHSPVKAHVGHSQIGAVMNEATVDIPPHVFLSGDFKQPVPLG